MKTFPLIDFAPKAFARSLRVKPLPEAVAEEYAAALLKASKLVVRQRAKFLPDGCDADDATAEVWDHSWNRAQKYRKTNAKKTLAEYCFWSARFGFIDWMRKLQRKSGECIKMISIEELKNIEFQDRERAQNDLGEDWDYFDKYAGDE